MYNSDNFRIYSDANECTSRGVCSSSPVIISLQELILLFLEHSSYYLLKLNKMGIDNQAIKREIIRDLAALVSINEFSDLQLYEIARKYYSTLISLKSVYKNNSKGATDYEEINLPIEFNENTSLPKSISLGEKLFLLNYKNKTSIIRNLSEILIVMLKGTAYNILHLADYKNCSFDPYRAILEPLYTLNKSNLNENQIKKYILKLSKYNYELQVLLAENVVNNYGKVSKSKVSHSTRAGKAILVSGDNLSELKEVLDAALPNKIDVYTHSELIISHSLNFFKKYDNLVGHFGGFSNSSIIDFASFQGPILLAGATKNTSDYLYRGRIYSSDFIVHPGVINIDNSGISDVIKSAISSKGFKKGKTKPDELIGFDYDDTIEKFNNIKIRLAEGDIKHLYIISLNPFSEQQKAYFNEFFKEIRDDEYVISFSYSANKNNILLINTGNYIPFAVQLLNEFLKNFNNNDKVTFLFTTCGAMSLSSIILLHSKGLNNIYMANCPPSIINPSVFDVFRNAYNVKNLTNASTDLNNIRKNKGV